MSKGLFGITIAMFVLISAFTAAIPSRTVHAWEWEKYIFEGVVTRPDGTPVPNLRVVATGCDDQPGSFTDTNGHYHIEAIAHVCSHEAFTISTFIEYSPNLSAKDKNTLINATAVAVGGDPYIANIVMSLKTVPVPEYDWLSGVIAFGGAIGTMTYIRRRHGRSVASKTI